MSNKNKLETKQLRLSNRLSHAPVLSPGVKIHPGVRLERRLRELPIDRVAREIKRAARRQRRGEKVLSTLAPNSMFAAPVKQTVRLSRVSGIMARAELKRRSEKNFARA